MAGDAAAATSTGTDGGAQNPGQDTQGQAPGIDPGQIMQQFQGLQSSQEDLRQTLQGLAERIPQPEQEPEPSIELDLASFLGNDQTYDQGQFTDDQNQRFNDQINSLVEQRVSKALEQVVGPVQQQMQELRDERAMDMLVSEFPIIGENPEVAKQTFDTANQLAMQLSGGQPWGAQLAQNPEFVRGVLLQSIGARALNDAASQSEAGADAGARLEGTGGAGPAGMFSGEDAAMQIVNAGSGPGGRVLDF